MKKINLICLFLLIVLGNVKAGEALDFYQADKKAGWELYVEGDALYLSGDLDKAILKWKEAASKTNLHAAARLYKEDLQNGQKSFATIYEPLLKDKFYVSKYLSIRYAGKVSPEKTEVLLRDVVKSMQELEDTEDFWALSIVGNYFAENFKSKDEFLIGVRFLQKAADGGYSPAQDKIGCLYWSGNKFFNMDIHKAIAWLEKGAKKKDKFACLHLAQILHKGAENFTPDISKSIPYYEEAAKQGLFDAYLNLVIIYEEGQTIAKDIEKSHHYLSMLLDCQDIEIYKFLGTRYFHTNDDWKDKKKGLLWYELAASIGTNGDKYKLGDLYFSDKEIQNYEKARTIFLSMLSKNDEITEPIQIMAYLRLGAIYFNGYGVKQDYLEAKKYYNMVAHTSEALEAIIAMYLNGWGVKQSDEMVLFYISKLMDPTRAKGYEPGPYFEILGNIYKKRNEKEKSTENYRLAALCGLETSLAELKKIYTPLDAASACDLGDIYFAILNFEEANSYYQRKESKNYARSRYNSIRLLAIEKNKNYNLAKSVDEMKLFVEEMYAVTQKKFDHKITDRIIDPELEGVPLKARGYYWLALHAKKLKTEKDDKSKVVEESASYFLLAEKNGCPTGGLNAASVYFLNDTPAHTAKAREIVERLYKEKNPFAAVFMGGLSSVSKFGKIDLQKAKEYQNEALAWGKDSLWSGMSVDTFINKGVMQVLMPNKQEDKK
jgi:TPR repeat protein